MTLPTFPGVARDLSDERRHRRDLATVVNRINAGKVNAVGEVTLTASATTTTITDPRLTPTSFLSLWPLTANAAAELDAQHPYAAEADRGLGSWVLTHRSDAGADRSFRFLIIG